MPKSAAHAPTWCPDTSPYQVRDPEHDRTLATIFGDPLTLIMPRLPFLFTFRCAKHLQGSDVSFPGCPVGQFYQEALPRGIIGRILGLMPVQVIEMSDIDQLMAGAGMTHIPPAGCVSRHVVFIQNPIHREAKWRESRCLNRIQDHHFK